VEAFDRGLSPEWEDAGVVERACGTSAPGRETWAALLRLRRANEQLVLHDAVELLRLRNDVTSHLATGLR
jgi:hypothetical protein